MTVIINPLVDDENGGRTFLQLVQRVRQECSVGQDGQPTTVVGQIGRLKQLVDWTADAWREIQGPHLWDWMWGTQTLTMLANTNELDATLSPTRYVKESGYIGTSPIDYLPWELFRRVYPASGITAGVITAWSVKPDRKVVVNAKPTANTAIDIEFYGNVQDLTDDGDVPDMPAEFHLAIVWKAVVKYASEAGDGALRKTAGDELARLMSALHTRCLPEIRLGAALC